MRVLTIAALLACAFVMVRAKDKEDDDDDCGEMCEFFVGIFVDQVLKHIVVPSIQMALASSNLVFYSFGVASIVVLAMLVICAFVDKVRDYSNASGRKRTSMARKDASRGAGYLISSKFL